MSFFRAVGGNKFKIVNGAAKVRVATSKILYFNGAVDNDWNTLGNWWLDDQFSVPATHLPRSIDSVIVTGNITNNSGNPPAVLRLTTNTTLAIDIIVTEIAVFNGSISNYATIYGNCTFNSTGVNGGTVTGDAIFNDASINGGTVGGNATFNNNSYSYGTVTGNATFNGSSYNSGTVTGNATFNDSSFNDYGTVSGDATFNGNAVNYGTVTGDATFGDFSVNSGTVTGNATFNNNSSNYGPVTGTATFTGDACNNSIAGTFIPDPPPSCPV
jgi:hypothetical protein